MGLLDWLAGSQQQASDESEIDTVRRIAAELDTLPPERARFVACFAYILGRVANADFDVSDEEVEAMERLVSEHTELPPVQATLVVQIAKQRNQLFGGTDNFLVTRKFGELANLEQKRSLLDCLYAVSSPHRKGEKGLDTIVGLAKPTREGPHELHEDVIREIAVRSQHTVKLRAANPIKRDVLVRNRIGTSGHIIDE